MNKAGSHPQAAVLFSPARRGRSVRVCRAHRALGVARSTALKSLHGFDGALWQSARIESMCRLRIPTPFLLLIACAVAFLWLTSQSLPDVVGSHFDASGAADGFMPRSWYVGCMLVMVVVFPLLLVIVQSFVLGRPRARINLPNREYWLAPERRTETIDFLRQHLVHFGSMLVVFLSYTHWLVVRANAVTPPRLAAVWFVGGICVFLAAALLWVRALLGHFRNVPR